MQPSRKTGTLFIFFAPLVFLLLVFQGVTAFAHGTRAVSVNKGAGACFSFTDGTPMAYSSLKVWLDKEERPYQVGATDRNGCFMVRQMPGHLIRLVVEDGLGHRHEHLFDFRKGPSSAAVSGDGINEQATQMKTCLMFKAAAGVFFLISGCLAYALARNKGIEDPGKAP